MTTPEDIGSRIRECRKARGLTQHQLAALLFIGRDTLASWEVGRATPRVPFLVLLADSFGVTLDWLIAGRETHDRRVLIGGQS